ncbi:MAG: flavodoxin domain-containing protein [Defluviitaleaceae bacterium]|nr:flavodoxin domain-containing protein [Defluviitaleaceae bacterium]
MDKLNKVAVIYKSKYGATKTYAEWLAEALDAPLFEASEVNLAQLMSYELVVYGGGLYAGGINGVKLVAKNPCKALVVFTVGLADPSVTDYSEFYNRHFTPELLDQIKIVHLRGNMNYSKLGLIDRGLMALLKNQTAKKDEAEMDSDDKLLLETYGRVVDFMDKKTIDPIVAFVHQHLSAASSHA